MVVTTSLLQAARCHRPGRLQRRRGGPCRRPREGCQRKPEDRPGTEPHRRAQAAPVAFLRSARWSTRCTSPSWPASVTKSTRRNGNRRWRPTPPPSLSPSLAEWRERRTSQPARNGTGSKSWNGWRGSQAASGTACRRAPHPKHRNHEHVDSHTARACPRFRATCTRAWSRGAEGIERPHR